MDANFLSPSFKASASVVQPATPAAASPGAVLRGADFANLLGSLLADPGRQGLAAAGLAEAGLQAVPLGPQIELITAVAPVPDAGSLMAFARSQGLDESTLAALFGDMAAPPPTTASAGGSAGLNAVAALEKPNLQAPMAAAYLFSNQPVLAHPVNLPAPASALTSTSTSTSTGLPLQSALAAPADAMDAALTAVAVKDLAWQVIKAPVQTPLMSAAAVGEVKPVSAEDAMQDALRVQLQLPREAITALTRRLATLSGNGQAQVWGNLTASAMATASPTPLNMREFFTPAGLLVAPSDATDAADAIAALQASSTGVDADADADADSVAALPMDGSRKASGSLTLTPDIAPSQAGQRAEHYQQLADRLGQALAQRLQAQIERGEWKMQMRMDPASLGRIDLELDMRAGGLDAVFRSDNPLTRELIAQGLPKLRDSLAQSGTAVANVWVNGDSARQSGGNPTPSQTPRSSSQKQSDADGGSGQPLMGSVPAGGVRQGGSSGTLDVLA
jgi:flagellar hook-length control protein FliK